MTSGNPVAENLEILDSLVEFAYANGYGELGFDPVHEIAAEIDRLRNSICGYVNAHLAGRGSTAHYWWELQAIAKECANT